MEDQIVYAIGSLVGVIIWFIRLEGRVKACEKFGDLLGKEIDAVIIKHEALDSRIVEELARVRESLARIEGSMNIPSRKEKK